MYYISIENKYRCARTYRSIDFCVNVFFRGGHGSSAIAINSATMSAVTLLSCHRMTHFDLLRTM